MEDRSTGLDQYPDTFLAATVDLPCTKVNITEQYSGYSSRMQVSQNCCVKYVDPVVYGMPPRLSCRPGLSL